MHRAIMCRMLLFAALGLCCVEAGADEYWSYQYKDFDVTVAGSGAGAVALAHNLARYDAAISRVLNISTTYHVPTHVFVLTGKLLKSVTGSSEGASFQSAGFDVTVVTDAGPGAGRDWGVYFGYTGGLLISDRATRYPYWLTLGAPELFATPSFEREHVLMGGVGGLNAGYAQTLLANKLIPLRVFLSLRQADPQLKDDSPYAKVYGAQAWYLTREILVEDKYRPEFSRYIELMSQGTGEREAFAGTFKVSYEDLDKFFEKEFRAPTHQYRVPVPAIAQDAGTPVRLSDAEISGRLALLLLQWGHPSEALQYATDSLRSEPANESALRAAALANLRMKEYAAALAAVDKLEGEPGLSARAYDDAGYVLASLTRVSSKQAALPTDAATLSHRAVDSYERALGADSEDLRAWTGLADVYRAARDVQGAKALLPRAEEVVGRHPRNAPLVRSLAYMSMATNQTDAAFRFTEFWLQNAITDTDRDTAAAFLSRLKSHPLGASAADAASPQP
jgi:tetratricopeptide (TPR) repeat protein